MTSDGIPPAPIPTPAEELRTARQALNVASVAVAAYGEIIDSIRRGGQDVMPIAAVLELLGAVVAALGGATDALTLGLDLPDTPSCAEAMAAIEKIKAETLVKS